jgi:pimeloyl-ACP methyl ester carboxylesterase
LGLVLSRPAWLDAPNPWNVQMFSLITELIRQHGARRGQELFTQTDEYQDTRRQWPDVANSLALQFESPQVEETAFKYERIINDAPSRDRRQWASIIVPTLVLANRQDPVHPFEYGETLARSIPGGELKEITAKSVSIDQHGADVQRELQAWLGCRFLKRP